MEYAVIPHDAWIAGRKVRSRTACRRFLKFTRSCWKEQDEYEVKRN